MNDVSPDPILYSVVQKQLDHISKQMGWVMIRTARSPLFSESHDFSCFVCDAAGNALAMADGIPIHTGGGSFAVRAVLEVFGGRIDDGDVFLLSDPYVAGGNHLPDWTIIRPVLVDGVLRAFACNRAHQSDIGGGAAGTYNPDATEIFHEGLRLPVLKLVAQKEIRDDLWQLLLINSRCPDLLDGDLRAMLGSTAIGAERVRALFLELGDVEGDAVFRAILDYGERAARMAIDRLPDGEYFGEDHSDNDCFGPANVSVRAKITIAGDEIAIDFEGSSPQIKGFKNSSLANTYSSVYLAVVSFVGSQLPKNEGTFRPIRIKAPLGTVVNARPPAPMTMNTNHPATEIIHACWKALSQADPALACACWGKTSHCITSGVVERDRTFVMYHWHGLPAGGAVRGRDGFNTVGQLCTLGGMTLPNVEAFERHFPVRIHQYEFRCDAGGPGEYRGGTGVVYSADVDVEADYSFRGEGTRSVSGIGVDGGSDGAIGDIRIALKDGTTFDPPQYGVRRLSPLQVHIASPGGGGVGDPYSRSAEQVLRDVKDGVVSVETARDVYGVAVNSDYTVDEQKTRQLRVVSGAPGRKVSEGRGRR